MYGQTAIVTIVIRDPSTCLPLVLLGNGAAPPDRLFAFLSFHYLHASEAGHFNNHFVWTILARARI